ncbi:MAG: phosphoribosyltransferase [Burkholderiales bacterium]|nr:phosphoribosyltransferase [Burkholderiales bacterium]
MFRDRQDAALQLAQRLKARALTAPVVLGIPRGGVVVGAVLARELCADLDVVLARKLRAPGQPELAIGAIGEDGVEYLNDYGRRVAREECGYLAREREHQLSEIRRRRELFRAARPAAPVAGRSVILTDDGIATGSTMIAALHVLKASQPHEIVIAVPVAPPETLEHFRPLCSRVECLLAPEDFGAIGAFYRDFEQVEDEEVLRLLRAYHCSPSVRRGDAAAP